MAKNLEQSGVLQVNGAWATSLKYESEVLGARQGVVDLRFMQGRSEIARASLLNEEVAEVIGEKNAARISRHLAGDADKYLGSSKVSCGARGLNSSKCTSKKTPLGWRTRSRMTEWRGKVARPRIGRHRTIRPSA